MQEKRIFRLRQAKWIALALVLLTLLSPVSGNSQSKPFSVEETTIADIHAAYKAGQLTSHQLVQMYLNRIEAYDKNGPKINSIITVNPKALEEADRLDAAFKASGLVGPFHGIPVLIKDQVDAKGLPTTLGSILFKNYYPQDDSFVVAKLRSAGAIILGKATLGEMGGGDTFGSLFGATRNPYDLERTVGGSSGGSGASVSANFATVTVGEEGFASIRRPGGWNAVVSMRPTAGVVSRTGMKDGWPSEVGSLGPMARTVTDMAKLLDIMVGYDPKDPITALGVGNVPDSYTKSLDKGGLKGARLGILRESIGFDSEPDSEDFQKVSEVFDKAVGELKAAGAEVVDPIVIPNLKKLLATRAGKPGEGEEGWKAYFGNNPSAPFKSSEEMRKSPDYEKVKISANARATSASAGADPRSSDSRYYDYLLARQELMINVMKVMADHRLDAIVYKTVEHQPTLIRDGLNPPFVGSKGAPSLNTFLVYVPVLTVPAGFSRDNLPVGITFQGRPYSEGALIKLAYAYEQATHHRKPPPTVPPLR